MIHYHGGPINPETCAIRTWKARHAFVSYAHPHQIKLVAEICQSFALDNGAFSFWKAKKPTDWAGYYDWVKKWMRHPGFDFAVIPDVIEGSETENDHLASSWPFDKNIGAVVWHVNESSERLLRLARNWSRVCIGSSGIYDVSKPSAFLERMETVLPKILDQHGYPICKLHGLRMLNQKLFTKLPLATADSTNVARNIKLDKNWRGTYQPTNMETRSQILVERIEYYNSVGSRPDLACLKLNIQQCNLW
jgi:hypothetical protein